MITRSLLVLVPARGGSKGLPRKNACSLGGIPLLGWTAQAVRGAGPSGDASLVLSTDDAEIAAIGREVGLETPFLRPAELATDTASAVDVALHALDWFEQRRGIEHRALMLLQPTSPFRPPHTIAEALQLQSKLKADSVIGVKPIQRSLSTLFRRAHDGVLAAVGDASATETRRQSADMLWTPNGALYLVGSGALRSQRSFFPPRLFGIVMDQIASLDIDDQVDLQLAEAVVQAGLAWRPGGSLEPGPTS